MMTVKLLCLAWWNPFWIRFKSRDFRISAKLTIDSNYIPKKPQFSKNTAWNPRKGSEQDEEIATEKSVERNHREASHLSLHWLQWLHKLFMRTSVLQIKVIFLWMNLPSHKLLILHA
jgi:hypothetical protein